MIDQLLDFTKDTPSCERFRRWAAIHAVGAAGERRIWSNINGMKLFPNLFLFLVGPPGVGKSAAINPVSEVLRRAQVVHIAPTDMTKQGFLDVLIEAGGGGIDASGEPFDYKFMSICISELSNFMDKYDGALAGLLTDLFDCPPILEEKKRGQAGDPKVILFPGVSFIMGTATQNLGATISDEMWGSGFMARVILVYSAELIRPPSADAMFSVAVRKEHEADQLIVGLREVKQLQGEMAWTPEAQHALWDFWIYPRNAPIHNRLAHYVTRRWLHLAKLMMISALSYKRMEVRIEDFHTARTWLLDVEADMPEIFKDMISHEDGKIYSELQLVVYNHMTQKRAPIDAETMIAFLSQRVSSWTIPRILEVAENGGFIQRVAGTSGAEARYVVGANFGQNLPGIL